MASAAWRRSAALPPARVQALAASLWPPRVLALVLAVAAAAAGAGAVAVALMPRALALLVVVLMPRALVQPLAVAPTRALVLPGPFLSVHCWLAAPVPRIY